MQNNDPRMTEAEYVDEIASSFAEDWASEEAGDGGSSEAMKWARSYAREAAEAYGGTDDEWMRRGRRAALDMER